MTRESGESTSSSDARFLRLLLGEVGHDVSEGVEDESLIYETSGEAAAILTRILGRSDW